MAANLVELSREECLGLLAERHLGRLAVTVRDGRPLIRPVNYVFDERSQSVVFRTSTGSKLRAILAARQAAFEVDSIDLEAHTGWSVIVTGKAEEVTHPAEVRRLDGLGLEAWTSEPRERWVRIRAWQISGRRIGT